MIFLKLSIIYLLFQTIKAFNKIVNSFPVIPTFVTNQSSFTTSSQPSNSSFEGLFQWNSELCEQVLIETHLYPPEGCFQFYSTEQKKELTSKHSQLYIKNILITGTARSGTTMVAALASTLGINLSNDAHPPTPMGTVSWMLAAPPGIDPMCSMKQPSSPRQAQQQQQTQQKQTQQIDEMSLQSDWGSNHNKYRFKHIFHQVRNPLTSIPSLVTEIPYWKKCKEELIKILPNMNFNASPEHMALQIWVEWNSRLDRFPFIPIYRVEDFNLIDLLVSINQSYTMTEDDYLCAYRKFLGFNTRSTTLIRQKITWKHIYALNSTLALQAMNMAFNYGYRYYKNSSIVSMKPTYSQKYQRNKRKQIEKNVTNTTDSKTELPQTQKENKEIRRKLVTKFSPSTPSNGVRSIRVIHHTQPQFPIEPRFVPPKPTTNTQTKLRQQQLILQQQQLKQKQFIQQQSLQLRTQQQYLQQLRQKQQLKLNQQHQQTPQPPQGQGQQGHPQPNQKYFFMEKYSTTCNLMERGLYHPGPEYTKKLTKIIPVLNLIELNESNAHHKLFDHSIFIE